MTDEKKKTIEKLRDEGLPFSQIASRLELSANTVKSYYQRLEARKKKCKHCGQALSQIPKQKPKTFCSNWCRNRWWKDHRAETRHKTFQHLVCASCSKAFDTHTSYRRKYCCHPCYIRHRYSVS